MTEKPETTPANIVPGPNVKHAITHPPYAIAIYEAVRALLRHGHFARLEIGPGELEDDITVGLHAGWGDGEFVVMSRKGKCEWGLATCDGSVARELAAALTAYADWCDEDAEAFLAGIKAHRRERVLAREGKP